MKYVKSFNNFNESTKYGSYGVTDIAEDISEDIIGKLEAIKKERGSFTIQDFIDYMEERGSDDKTTDDVMHYLVNKGFEFSSEETEEPLTPEEIESIKLK